MKFSPGCSRGLRLVLTPMAAAVLLTGCYGLRPAVAPMPTLPLAQGQQGADCLVVLLPGRGDGAEDFLLNDFARIAADGGVAADVVAAEAHMGYYRARSLADRLHRDVVAPARARGQRVWLAGISLGGLGSLLYLAQYPGEIEGVVVLSPFLGDGVVLDEIEAAGRLAAWEGAARDLDEGREPEGQEVWRRLWTHLRQVTGGGATPLYLAYGTGDRLARSNRLLDRELPAGHVFTAEGGHDWQTWTTLWRQVTGSGIPTCPPGPPPASPQPPPTSPPASAPWTAP